MSGEMYSCRATFKDPAVPLSWRTKVPNNAMHKFLFPIDFLPELGPEDCPEYDPVKASE
jgi:hypothetical protein